MNHIYSFKLWLHMVMSKAELNVTVVLTSEETHKHILHEDANLFIWYDIFITTRYFKV